MRGTLTCIAGDFEDMVKARNPRRGCWEEVNWRPGENRKASRHKGLSLEGGQLLVVEDIPVAIRHPSSGAWASSHAAAFVSASTWR
jgi:hypothetical protein